jgi:hypothetical protein
VKILPFAISAVVDDTPGVHRSQLVQTGPATIRLRLEMKSGVDGEKAWRDVIANLNAYLADQGLANVELVRTSEARQQKARFGKSRQVIGVLAGTGGTSAGARRAPRPMPGRCRG